MPVLSSVSRLAVGLLCVLCAAGVGAEPAPLPEPLTLDAALSLADEAHPDLSEARAELDRSRAGLLGAQAQQGVNIGIQGRLRWVEPADVAPNRDHDDSAATLYVRKNLYDFGRTEAAESAAQAQAGGAAMMVQDVRAQRRIAIMERFFDVLIADMEFARDDEGMAVAYVTLDRLRDRNELGQVSDIDLLETTSSYQKARLARATSERRQRIARSALANALNRPGQLPSNVVRPDLPQVKRALPSYEALLAKAMQDNPSLQAVRLKVEAAQQQLAAAQAVGRPRVDGELEASAYSRELGSSDKFRATLSVDIPLYTGGTVDAAVAKSEADLKGADARLRRSERLLRQSILEQWSRLGDLQVQRDQVLAQRDYRDLYLDRSRAVYEMEVKTDLGDAMVRLTEAQLAQARTDFAIALGWATMDALTGGPLPQGQDSAGADK